MENVTLEMKHPKEYQQVLEHKKRTSGFHKGRKSLSTICSSTDDDEFRDFATTSFSLDTPAFQYPSINLDDEIEADEPEDDRASRLGLYNPDDNKSPSILGTPTSRQPASDFGDFVTALELAARPLRCLALFAGTSGIKASQLTENKHLKELLTMSGSQMLMPASGELEQQINLEISDVLLRIHRRLNTLPHGFCVSADTSSTSMGIVAHFWSMEEGRPATAALDIIHLHGQDKSLEMVAETLKHAFDKTDLNAARIYRTIVESSSETSKLAKNSLNFSTSNLKIDEHNYSRFHVGSCAAYRLRSTIDDIFTVDSDHKKVQKKLGIFFDRFAENRDLRNLWQAQFGNLQFPQNLNWFSWRDLYELVVGQATPVNQFLYDQKLPQLSRPELQLIGGFLRLEKAYFGELKVMSTTCRLAHLVSTALASRFVDVLTSIDEQADPFYLATAFLDPTCSRLLKKNVPVHSSFKNDDDLDREINEYLNYIQIPWTQGSGFDFWRLHLSKFPILAPLALSILIVPATSREVKRLLDGLDHDEQSGQERWKRALLVYNDSFICI
ncbi:hypothetical protein M3Y97_01003500 [Aphelenchoides bicaudatus]|nr:hypothetical protein M3Y97_01003500 [Aphelenchoides bicaudatus]